MPLLRFDLIKGRTDDELTALLDATHRAVVAAFKVPLRDRYHVVNQHAAAEFTALDTGLGIVRTEKVVILSITSRPRDRDSKIKFYTLLCQELASSCGLQSSDVIVTITTNSDEDWSFGLGRAQFLTGEL